MRVRLGGLVWCSFNEPKGRWERRLRLAPPRRAIPNYGEQRLDHAQLGVDAHLKGDAARGIHLTFGRRQIVADLPQPRWSHR
jgi:hypothetical protein